MNQKCEYCNTNNAIHFDGQNHVCQECIDFVEEAFKKWTESESET